MNKPPNPNVADYVIGVYKPWDGQDRWHWTQGGTLAAMRKALRHHPTGQIFKRETTYESTAQTPVEK